MIVYGVWDGVDEAYFTTKAEAIKHAKWLADMEAVSDTQVDRLTFGSKKIGRQLAVALLSRSGWCEHRETIAIIPFKPE